MSSGWDFTVNTGNPEADRQTAYSYEQQYRAQGMQVSVQPLPAGGFHVSIQPPGAQAGYGAPPAQQAYPQAAPQQQYGAPQQQYAAPAQQGYPAQPQYGAQPQQQYGAPAQPQQQYPQQPQQQYGAPQAAPNYGAAQAAYAMAGGGAAAAPATGGGLAAAVGAPPIAADRVRYLRKVYGLLGASAFVAILCGWACINVGPTVAMTSPDGHPAQVPFVVSLMLGNNVLLYGAFGVLVAATFVASWVSKVKYVNIAALFAVGGLMGLELAPMVFVAQFYAGMGATMSANPVRDTFMMVFAVFIGITAYVFLTRKDFSYLYAFLSMGFWVILIGCGLTFFLDSEPFALAIATGGALLSIGFILYVTSYIFRNSDMDDPVGDALALLVQLRNLFMFLLRILMSSRD